MKTLTKEMVEFTIQCENEETPIQKALSEAKTGANHKEYIDKVLKDDGFNPWLWCSVTVVAKFKGLMGFAYLGQCAYENEKEFKQGGYYEQMQDESFNDLKAQVDELLSTLNNG